MKKQSKSDKLRTVAYCGLYCPKCYKMKIAFSAKQLLFELESAQKKGASFLQDDPSIREILDKLIDLECMKFCREGGGKSATCPIKACCDEHNIIGCWECPDFGSCKTLKKQFFDNNCKLREVGLEKYIKEYK